MASSKLLPKIGSKVKINVNKVNDRLPIKLMEQISNSPKATILGYKMTDGRSIGLIVKFDSGQENWFFPEEIERG
mgnify:CR=1 FL=1|tara:strand:- start:788 stop:1012 length:225 start_codon:yes stop_codon:yes gene_type:complete